MERILTALSSKEYCFSLSDGRNWGITGDKDNIWWIEKLAAIMELEECASTDAPKLAFSRARNKNDGRDGAVDVELPKLCSKGPDPGWVSFDLELMRMWCHKNITDVICEVKNKDDNTAYIMMWISLYPIYLRSIHGGGLPFHAGLVELEGRGVVLAAPGGTGKSTCCRRLPDYWKALCDDTTLVVLNKQKEYRAHPFPTWSDYMGKRSEKTWDVQHSVPLAGAFFLEQSETDEVVSVGEGQAAVFIYESATQICQQFWGRVDREDQRKFRRELFDNACEMAKVIPVFILRVSLHGRFWEEMEKALGW